MVSWAPSNKAFLGLSRGGPAAKGMPSAPAAPPEFQATMRPANRSASGVAEDAEPPMPPPLPPQSADVAAIPHAEPITSLPPPAVPQQLPPPRPPPPLVTTTRATLAACFSTTCSAQAHAGPTAVSARRAAGRHVRADATTAITHQALHRTPARLPGWKAPVLMWFAEATGISEYDSAAADRTTERLTGSEIVRHTCADDAAAFAMKAFSSKRPKNTS